MAYPYRSVFGIPYGSEYDPNQINMGPLSMAQAGQIPTSAPVTPAVPAPQAAPAPDQPDSPPAVPDAPMSKGADLKVEDIVPKPPSGARKFWAAVLEGGGASPRVVQDALQPDAAYQQMTMRVKQANRLFPGDPVKQALWVQQDDEFKKALSSNFTYQKLAKGETGVNGVNGSKYTAPDQMGDVIATPDPNKPGQVVYSRPRPKTYAETETETKDRNEEANKQDEIAQKAAEASDRNRTLRAVATGRRGVNQAIGEIMDKMASGEQLSPGETEIWNTYKARGANGLNGFDFGNPPPGAPKPQSTPAPQAAPQTPPTIPAPPQLKGAKEGSVITQGKYRWVYKGGKLTYAGPAQ